MKRINKEITKKIVDSLKNGILKELLSHVTRDDTLELEFRENYISIYYRGGCVSKLVYKSDNCYEDYFDNNYKDVNISMEEDEEEVDKNSKFQGKIETNEQCKELVDEIIKRKNYMNYFFSVRPKREREYQQLVERENNDRKESNFYIADVEYKESNSRFDMIAIQRKDSSDYTKLKLAIIEMKYGEKAIGKKCGVYDHFVHIKKLDSKAIEDIIEDTEVIMNYKNELGLIKTMPYIDRGIEIKIRNEIDLIFFISGIAQKHNNELLKELEKINRDLEEEVIDNNKIKINIKIFSPYLAGNLMFDKDVISIENFLKLNEFRKNMK